MEKPTWSASVVEVVVEVVVVVVSVVVVLMMSDAIMDGLTM